MLSLLMAVQAPVIAEELVAADETLIIEETVQEELNADEGFTSDEVILEEDISEELSVEEEPAEDNLVSEDIFEEESGEEFFEAITEDVDALQEEADPVNDESLLEEDEPALTGVSSGQCGDNVYYTLSDEGVLTISGSGDMWDWIYRNYETVPWWDNKEDIIKVVIEADVTSIGSYVFWECSSLTSVTIGESVTRIGGWSFYRCSALTSIYFKGGAPEFVEYAFYSVTATAYYPIDNPTWTEDARQQYGETITWVPVGSDGRKLFNDVTDPSQFYYEPIYWAVDEGITIGFNDNTFRPMNNCNRVAVVTFLWRLAGKPDAGISDAFKDMTGDSDFDHAITWAAEEGITTGYDDNTFRPWDQCLRLAIVSFLYRYP